MNNRSALQAASATALTGVNQTLSAQQVFLGITASDAGSGSFKVHVYHGTSDTDPHIAAIQGNAGHTDSIWFGPNGVACPNGIYVKVYSGTPEGSIFTK